MQTVFEAAGGDEGLRRLAYAWHREVGGDGGPTTSWLMRSVMAFTHSM